MGVQILFVNCSIIIATHILTLIVKLIITNRQMLADHKPQKQNRSPEKHRSPEKRKNNKQLKQIRTLEQLYNLLTTYGVGLSSFLQTQINPRNKLNDGQKDKELSVENRKLRVKLNDYEFQIKKLTQDFAEYKLLAKMDKEKVVKRLREDLEIQKVKNIQENKKWLNNFQERQKKYVNECQQLKLTTQSFYRSQKTKQLSELRQEYSIRLHKISTQKEQLQHLSKQNIQTLHQRYNSILLTKEQTYKTSILQLQLQLKKTIQHYQQKYEQKIVIMQLKKQQETKQVQQIKKQTQKNKDMYLNQIGKIEIQKKSLVQKYDQLQMNFKVLTKRFEDKQRQVQELRVQFRSQVDALEIAKNNDEKQLRQRYDQQKLQLLKSQYAKMQKCQQKLLKLYQIKESTVQNYKAMLKAIQVKFNRRQSKKQDIQALKLYEQQLHHKQKQNHHIYEQLKLVRLQKQNNDKIYTKIFTVNKDKRNGSLKNKDINNLFKQGNSTDIRFLLNISHK